MREGKTVDVKCSTTGSRKPLSKVYVYLCKNGIGMRVRELEKGEDDTIFTIKDVEREDSGIYSCVYTIEKLKLSQVNATGVNLVIIQVYRDGEGRTYFVLYVDGYSIVNVDYMASAVYICTCLSVLHFRRGSSRGP